MTEAEWMGAEERVIRDVVARLDPRRQRLLSVAVCRAMGRWVDFPAVYLALEAVEKFADTNKTKAALHRARQAIQSLRVGLSRDRVDGGTNLALFVIQVAASENAVAGTLGQAIEALRLAERVSADAVRHRYYGLYRDIVGNPFRPATFDPAWRTSTAISLAKQMYDSRDFGLMPILGDALQDAGCDNDDILAHCRDPQAAHVRGCWVVDLVLGKS